MTPPPLPALRGEVAERPDPTQRNVVVAKVVKAESGDRRVPPRVAVALREERR